MSACRIALVICMAWLFCQPATAFTVEQHQANGVPVLVVRVDLRHDDLRLFWAQDDQRLYRRFERIDADLQQQGQSLRFAMNAGMYHPNRAPVGLYIESGQTRFPLNLADGVGNFFLKPNGVFGIDRHGQAVITSTEDFARQYKNTNQNQTLNWATQSGPMLVIKGQLHPAFDRQSVSKTIRNGVGRVDAQHLVFAISQQPINFYDFAQLFRDQLGCQDALYLDGSISSIYLPDQPSIDVKSLSQREDAGVMLGVVSKPVAQQTDRHDGIFERFRQWIAKH